MLLLPQPSFGRAPAEAAQESGNVQSAPAAPIVVRGQRESSLIVGIAPEDELGEEDIASYGADSVGELLDRIGADVDQSEDGPVVLVNGERVTGADEIADLPPEALSKVQLLPRDAAARIGEKPQRRVINVQLKRSFRQGTASADRTFATAGKGGSTNAALGYTGIAGMNRTSVIVRLRDTELLLESDRPIQPQVTGSLPYDLLGNVVPLPTTEAEIDQLLSAAAGRVVSVAGLDGSASPTLAALAARANLANLGGIGDYRSLVPDSRTWSLNATIARRLGPRTSFSVKANGDITTSNSVSGAASAFLRVSPISPFSPFDRAVGVARFLPVPLENNRKGGNGTIAATLNQSLGKWNASATANYSRREERTRYARGIDTDALQAAVDGGLVSPFATPPQSYLATVQQERARAINESLGLTANLSGPLTRLPAGPIILALRGGAGTNRQETTSSVVAGSAIRRNNVNGQVSLDIPLASRQEKAFDALGDLRLNLALGLERATGVGRLWNQSYGATWSPVEPLNLRATFTQEDIAPYLESLNAPLIVYPNVRFFDFVQGETVDVTILSGGNPDLPKQQRRTLNFGGTWSVQDKGRLTLNADYSRTRNLNQIAGLPPLNAEVQAAFSERFTRDAQGRLIQVDSRPVSFAREERQQLRWGINLVRNFGKPEVRTTKRLGGGTAPVVAGEDGESGYVAPVGVKPWRFSLNASHIWTLTATRLARAGLDPVNGGALGYGGGQPRHTLQFNANLGGKGMGVQTTGTWRAATTIRAGTLPSVADLRYAPRTMIDVRVFADLGTLLPQSSLAKGTRLSLNVRNVFDSRQRVTDGAGATPLRYQPYLIDPLGRTVQVGLRKVF